MSDRRLTEEYLRRFGDLPRQAPPTTGARSYGFMRNLFDKQEAFIRDPAKLKAALCSRRAGKTTSLAYYLVETALKNPYGVCIYITLTRASAKRIMWRELNRMRREYDLDLDPNNTDLSMTAPNGAIIYVAGADNASDIDKFRGLAVDLVVIDEAGSFGGHLRELVEEVLEPSLIDRDGTLCMTGTPTAACSGMFYDATEKANSPFSLHKWTILDNPHIPHAAAWLKKRKADKGWDDSNPIYLREWCGVWVYDTDSLVYKYDETKNTYDPADPRAHQLLIQLTNFGTGIDLGYEDPTAFVIVGWQDHDPCLYVLEEYKTSHMLVSEIAERTKLYQDQYKPDCIVLDMGGLGKTIGEEIIQRYRIPVKMAEKSQKWAHIELLNDDLRRGLIKMPQNSQLAEEMKLLQKKESLLVEDDRFANHLCDALLYVWRYAKHYRAKPKEKDITPGSTEYYNKIEEKMITALEDEYTDQDTQLFWDSSQRGAIL